MAISAGLWNLDSSGAGGGLSRVAGNAASVWMGDSITQASAEKSIAAWTNFFLDGQLKHIVGFNKGVSGDKTSDMLARDSVALALNPQIYFILAGTNDVTGGVSAATITANLQTLIDNALATPSVELVVLRTILKRSDGTFTGNPAFATVRTAVNSWIRAVSHPKVLVIDYDLCAWDPTDTRQCADGLHPLGPGAMIIGEYTGDRTATRIASIDVLADQTGNLVNNPTLTGTAGTKTDVTGNVATSWDARNFLTGPTVVASKGVDAGSHITQIFTINGTVATGGSSGFLQFRCVQAYTGAGGESYEALATFKIENAPELGNVTMSSDGCISFGTTGNVNLDRDLEGVIRLGQTTLGGSDTSNTFSFSIYFPDTTVLTNTVVTISQPIWRRTN